MWISSAIFYEVYPQSFYDANGDGCGDIEGIIQKLDYIAALGCNALWLNPCFDSPFKDAGYDVRDYTRVAPRYGSNACLVRLFEEAHKRDMRVLLDLVPGHTSEEHPWFVKSKSPEKNDLWGRYIWTDNWGTWVGGLKTIFGESERNATYIVNFFKSQPALNYGFANPDQAWQMPPHHPDCLATRAALAGIMRFWLDLGCDGFRVDMASSLVKFDDAENSATCALWRELRASLEKDYPDMALVSEWSYPARALKCGFDADFLLAFHDNSAYAALFRDYTLDGGNNIQGRDNSYFKIDGHGDINRFLAEYLPHYEAIKNDGFISLVTGNHDLPRLSYSLTRRERELAFAFIFTMPGVPFLYYGDEIGMRYLPHLPGKEGGYHRTGSRTPMQWARGRPNLGFSSAPPERLYLPVDDLPSAPTAEEEAADCGSFFNFVAALIALRKSRPDLGSAPNFAALWAKPNEPFIYERGRFIAAVNPSAFSRIAPPARSALTLAAAGPPLFAVGQAEIAGGKCLMGPQSFAVWEKTALRE